MEHGSKGTDVENQLDHSHPSTFEARRPLAYFRRVYGGVKNLVNRKKGKKAPTVETSSMKMDVENQHPPALGSLPWLMWSHGAGGQLQTFFSISENQKYATSIPQMANKCICTCSHGWLVLLDVDTDECFLFNPVSLEKIQLPPMKCHFAQFCVLSSAPDNPDGCVIAFLFFGKFLQFCRPNDEDWQSELLDNDILCAIGYEGKIYGIKFHDTDSFSLLEVNPGSGMRLLREALPMPSPPKKNSSFKLFMVESCGEVFVIRKVCRQIYNPRVRYFEIFKVNLSTADWEKVEDLGDRALFIDLVNFYCVSSLAAQSGVKRNSIYFTGREKGLYIFDLEHKNISVSLPYPDLDFEDIEVYWIMSVPGYDENEFHKYNCEEENTLARAGSIPTSGNMMEGEYKGGNNLPVVENTISTIGNTMKKVIDMQQVPCSWADLSPELLSLIQKHLFASDRIYFGATCRNWQQAQAAVPIDSMDYSTIDHPSPCLLFSSTNNTSVKLFYPNYDRTYTLKLEEELFGAEICFSRDGWLLLIQNDHSMFFLKPSTKERIEVTPFPLESIYNAICFTSTPISPDCTIFGIHEKGDKVKIFMMHVGEDTWDVKILQNKRRRWGVPKFLNKPVSFSPSETNLVFHGGLLYCLDEEGRLGCFDPQRYSWTVSKTSWRLSVMEYDQNFLVECDGNLLVVFVGPIGSWIRVCRLDLSKMRLKNVDNLGDWMLFLSEKTSFSAKATVQGMRNKIYIQRLCANHGVFYSLATRRYHTFDSSYCGTDFCGTTEEVRGTWMIM